MREPSNSVRNMDPVSLRDKFFKAAAMFHCIAYRETLECMLVKQATIDGKYMGQYFHVRWWQWIFFIIESAEYLSLG